MIRIEQLIQFIKSINPKYAVFIILIISIINRFFNIHKQSEPVSAVARELTYLTEMFNGDKYQSKICLIYGTDKLDMSFLKAHDALSSDQSNISISKIHKTIFITANPAIDPWQSVIEYLQYLRPQKPINISVFPISYQKLTKESCNSIASKIIHIMQTSKSKIYLMLTELHLDPLFSHFMNFIDNDDDIVGILPDQLSYKIDQPINVDKLSDLFYSIMLPNLTASENTESELLLFWLTFADQVSVKLQPLINKLMHYPEFNCGGIYFSGKKNGLDCFLKKLFLRKILLDDVENQAMPWPSTSIHWMQFGLISTIALYSLYCINAVFINAKNYYIDQSLALQNPINLSKTLQAMHYFTNTITAEIIGKCSNIDKEIADLSCKTYNQLINKVENKILDLKDKVLAFQPTKTEKTLTWLSNPQSWHAFEEYVSIVANLSNVLNAYNEFVRTKQLYYLYKVLNLLYGTEICNTNDFIQYDCKYIHLSQQELIEISSKAKDLLNQFLHAIGDLSIDFENACEIFLSEVSKEEINLTVLLDVVNKILAYLNADLSIAIDNLNNLKDKPELIEIQKKITECSILSKIPAINKFTETIDTHESATKNKLNTKRIFMTNKNENNAKSLEEMQSFLLAVSDHGVMSDILPRDTSTLITLLRNMPMLCLPNTNPIFMLKIQNAIYKLCLEKIEKFLSQQFVSKLDNKCIGDLTAIKDAVNPDLQDAVVAIFASFARKEFLAFYKEIILTKLKNPKWKFVDNDFRCVLFVFIFKSLPDVVLKLNQCSSLKEILALSKLDNSNEYITILQSMLEQKYNKFLKTFKSKVKSIVGDSFPFKPTSELMATPQQINAFLKLINNNLHILEQAIEYSENGAYIKECINTARLLKNDYSIQFSIAMPSNQITAETLSTLAYVTTTQGNIIPIEKDKIYELTSSVKKINIVHTIAQRSAFVFPNGLKSFIVRAYENLPILKLIATPQIICYPVKISDRTVADFYVRINIVLPDNLTRPSDIT